MGREGVYYDEVFATTEKMKISAAKSVEQADRDGLTGDVVCSLHACVFKLTKYTVDDWVEERLVVQDPNLIQSCLKLHPC